MEQLILNGQIINVDIQKTKELYKELPLVSEKEHSGCSDCAFYAKSIVHTTPAIQQFFLQFGIDPRKEAEVWRACENDDGTNYYVADYHFIGEIPHVREIDWIGIEGASFGLTNHTSSLPSSMVPETFTPPIIEMIVKINLRPDI